VYPYDFCYYVIVPKTRLGFNFIMQPAFVNEWGYSTAFFCYQRNNSNKKPVSKEENFLEMWEISSLQLMDWI
jgi:hypothetical protein